MNGGSCTCSGGIGQDGRVWHDSSRCPIHSPPLGEAIRQIANVTHRGADARLDRLEEIVLGLADNDLWLRPRLRDLLDEIKSDRSASLTGNACDSGLRDGIPRLGRAS